MAAESTAHLRAVPAAVEAPSLVGANGMRAPSRRGAPRSLTEVIVELGSARANACSRRSRLRAAANTTADRVLLERGWISPEGVAIATAERHGLDYVD